MGTCVRRSGFHLQETVLDGRRRQVGKRKQNGGRWVTGQTQNSSVGSSYSAATSHHCAQECQVYSPSFTRHVLTAPDVHAGCCCRRDMEGDRISQRRSSSVSQAEETMAETSGRGRELGHV